MTRAPALSLGGSAYPESITPITAFLADDDNFTVSSGSIATGFRTAGGTRGREDGDAASSGIDRLCSQRSLDDCGAAEHADGRESSISQCLLYCATPTEYLLDDSCGVHTGVAQPKVGADSDTFVGSCTANEQSSASAVMGQ
jgi:hypothetical protein